jgi:hypothetical protein
MNRLALIITSVFLGMIAPMISAGEKETTTKFEVGRNVRVSSKGGPFVEPYITAHPEDAQSVIISASEAIHGKGIIAVSFFTSDGGRSWSTAALPQMQEALASGDLRRAIDNWVAYAPDGTAYYSTLASMKLQDKWRMPVLVYRSDDKGQSWQKPVVVAGTFDRPSLVATGQKDKIQLFGAAYVSGKDSLVFKDPVNADAIAVIRSDDGARSFRTTAFIAHNNLGHNAMNPLVLADGTLLVPYADYPNPKQQMKSSRIYVMRSQDGGRTFGLPHFVTDIPRPFPGFSQYAVDLSDSKYRGRVYAAWNGGGESDRNISIAHSTDNGQSWSSPRVLRAEKAGSAYRPAIAVSPQGIVGVLWIQVDGKPNDRCWRAYFAASIDGGEIFTVPQAVSDAVSCPDGEENKAKIPGGTIVVDRWAQGGDYIGIAAAADGSFHPVWIDGRDGAFQVYTARIRVTN